LRVLVTEAEPGAADEAARELEEAGHVVLRCCDAHGAPFPCAALREGAACPFDDGIVDVALTVRRHTRPQPTAREHGALCALHRHVPLVVAGSGACDPFAPWEQVILDRTFGVVGACERTAARSLDVHAGRARDAAAATLARAGIDEVPAVGVYRRRGRLLVRITTIGGIGRRLRSMVATRAVAAVRAFDRHAAGVDVLFATREEEP
jgi:hypothetical protein